VLALVAIVWGCAIGVVSGGSLRQLTQLRLIGEVFIVPCFVVQALTRGRAFALVGIPALSIGVWTAASVTLCVCLLLNWKRRGCYLAAVGVMLNVVVVLANHGMPVGPRPGSGDIGIVTTGAQAQFYLVDAPGMLLRVAADVLPLELRNAWLMLSVGDVLLAVGVGVVLVGAMLGELRQDVGE
jgi:hypothetical protein